MLSKAYVEITNRCNLSCAFCPGTKRPAGDMRPAQFRKLAPELKKVTNFVYFHLMGEPLFHPQLAQFLDIALEYELRVILTSNGTLLDSCDSLLLSHRAVHKLNLSLHSLEANDGFSPEHYIRSCGSFAKQAGSRGIICSLRLWNMDGEQPGLRQLNGEILSLLRELFPAPWIENAKGYRLAPKVFLEWGERFDWPDTTAPNRGSSGFCYALRDQVGILCDGTVVPCCLDHEGELALGNAFLQPLHEILESPQAMALYNGFSRRQRVAELCRHCGYAERFSK